MFRTPFRFLGLGLAVSGSVFAGADSLSYNLSNFYDSYGQSSVQSSYSPTAAPLTDSFVSNDVLGAAAGFATGTATAGYGVLKGGTDVLLTNQSHPITYYSATGYGQAAFTIGVTPTGTGLGSWATVLNLSGAVNSFQSMMFPAGFNVSGYFSLSVSLSDSNNNFIGSDSIRSDTANGTTTGTVLPTTWTTKQFDVTFGQTYFETVSLNWNAAAYDIPGTVAGPWQEGADVDLTHTVKWGGAIGYDANGNVINGFQLDGSTGRNWAQPAATPEPTSLLALTGGLAVLVRRRSNRKGA